MKFLTPEWHDKLASTNTSMLDRLRNGETLPTGCVMAARDQTAGRGRYDRVWQARPNRDLTFSFLMRTTVPDLQLMSLTMAVALAIADHAELHGVAARTKWPNDVLVGDRKIAGILAEKYSARQEEQTTIVVGIGLNVNLTGEEAAGIDRPATSLFIETEREYQVEFVLNELLEQLSKWILRWSDGGFPKIKPAWIDRCAYLGELITVGDKTGSLTGFGEGGELLLRSETGIVEPIWAGDVDVLRVASD